MKLINSFTLLRNIPIWMDGWMVEWLDGWMDGLLEDFRLRSTSVCLSLSLTIRLSGGLAVMDAILGYEELLFCYVMY